MAASASTPTQKEIIAYAHGYVRAKGGERQWSCFYRVINYESHWNHRAVNGRYYGLGQIANAKKRHVGKPYLQVRDAWTYMVNRYAGKACGAWSHIERVGWY
jgi:hypothetical protein